VESFVACAKVSFPPEGTHRPAGLPVKGNGSRRYGRRALGRTLDLGGDKLSLARKHLDRHRDMLILIKALEGLDILGRRQRVWSFWALVF
jgi:hypothetical protein